MPALRDHPFALFAVSNTAQQQWHFINVKYDEDDSKRRQFRRITIGKDERLRTAAERLEMLDLAGLTSLSPLGIQQTHDDAFDVEAVQKNFFKAFADLYDNVATDIAKVPEVEGEAGRIAQLLLDRMLFLYFIQKKDWLDKKTGLPLFAICCLLAQTPRERVTTTACSFRYFVASPTRMPTATALATFRSLTAAFLRKRKTTLDGTTAARPRERQDSTFKAIFEDLLEKFNFTVTEDTPLDEKWPSTPRCWARFFEPHPTIGKGPQKDGRLTGSYYTPRPIVPFHVPRGVKGVPGWRVDRRRR